MGFEPLSIDAGRICDGLSRIGYTPPAAITDIIDNAVNAGAAHVTVRIARERVVSDTRKDNVREYLIIDDGQGMNEAGIKNALQLGSSDADYAPDSLSKFGLGLKSASFSQGETLEIISSDGTGEFLKYRVSLPEIRTRGAYGAEKLALLEEDTRLIRLYLPDAHGTIVRITDIRKGNHPSIRSTVDELQQRVGVIYFYFMRDNGLHINIAIDEESSVSTPVDPLFTGEAEQNGNLDENTWNGKVTQWIQRPMELTLDAERNVKATIEVTQLPHPPTFALPPGSPADQTRTRDKYRIDAGNYGYYVYRNKRLLSWAERFAGTGTPIIPINNDFYSFRGRILLSADADDVINIDVKKAHIMLSDEAYRALDDVSAAYKRKSQRAWKRAGEEKRRIENADSIGTANRIAQEAEPPEELPGTPDSEDAFRESEERQRQLLEEQQQRFPNLAAAGIDTDPSHRIIRVSSTEDHALWEPYYDAERKNCVRINEVHRFAQIIYQDNSSNGGLQILFNLILLQLAAAEVYVETKYQKHPRTVIEAILREYRRVASEFLAHLCRESADSLPHDT